MPFFGLRMLWMAILGAIIVWFTAPGATAASNRGQSSYQINPKPCWVDGQEGTCMFVYECIKSEGYHIGMCVDTFMFGSCCAHNSTFNNVVPNGGGNSHLNHHNQHQHHNHNQNHQSAKPSILYTPPSHHFSQNKKPSKPVSQNRPNFSSSKPKTTSRPQLSHASTKLQSTSVSPRPIAASISIKPSSSRQPTQPPRHSLRPLSTDALQTSNSIPIASYTKPGWQSTTEPGFITSLNHNSIQHYSQQEEKTSSVFVAGSSTTNKNWQFTTEPGFVTRVKAKPSSFKPKPKPTKKPIPNTTNKYTSIKYGSKTTKFTTTTRPPPSSSSALPSLLAAGSVAGIAGLPSTTISQQFLQPLSVVSTEAPVQKVSLAPDFMPTSTFSSLVSAASVGRIDCGVPQMFTQPQTRIVGGKNAPFGRWPWQVSVRRTSFFGFSSTHRCGGAVLNENWIATAGHCVDDLLTSQIRIRVGEYDFSSVQEQYPYVERAVAKKIVHPKYNFFTYEYDLALVQLDKPLEFAPHISPICLPASDDLLIGENATVTGWGRLSEGGTLPSILQEVQVPIVSNDRCKSMFLRAGRHEFIPDIFLCAGHEGGGQDSCQGDSGGPLQVRGKDGKYFLAGIISWGIGCAEANLPGVCTRISKFVPWILKNVT